MKRDRSLGDGSLERVLRRRWQGDDEDRQVEGGSLQVEDGPQVDHHRAAFGGLSSELLDAASAAAGALHTFHKLSPADNQGDVARAKRQTRPTAKVSGGEGVVPGRRGRGGRGRGGGGLGSGPRGGRARGGNAGGCSRGLESPDDATGKVLPIKNLSSGTVIWAKQLGFPWWPAVVFRSWTAWRKFGLQVPQPESVQEFKRRLACSDVGSTALCKSTSLPIPAQGVCLPSSPPLLLYS